MDENMRKIHTLVKRRRGLCTHLGHYFLFHNVGRKTRPKTFSTEEAAHGWARQHDLQEGTYTLKSVKREKRYQVVPFGKN
ncbi:hypothetical protein HYW21_05455 [Candidatus Woesearchaeota archaeon]|nr:hypothetical protein [Candidatus Woesearchaeota archaeon]